ncbi:MAG TPA: hemerythrin domain-containing protein [Polyangiaceae bacterium]|jgi:hemerythrin-like domain-containing protein|nr:hemerythrin domain-containing protein [Polyangiaceae bacterium]
MKAVESLIREHQIIGRLADALEVYAQRTKQGPPPDAADLGRFAAAFIDFAERIHHDKEENILLPALARHGVRWDDGALPAVRREHRQESYLIDVLRQAGERAGSWNHEDRRHIAASAQALVDFQRNHHSLESTELLPLLDARLDAAAQAQLQCAIDKFDREHEALRAAALAAAESLSALYGAPRRSGVQAIDGQLVDDSEGSECCGGLED